MSSVNATTEPVSMGNPLKLTPALKSSVSVAVPCMSEFSVDVEGIRNGAQIVEIVVDHHPLGLGSAWI